jgi:class 3 adenylate cyclase
MDPLELGALMGDYFRLIGKVVTGRRGLEWGRAGDSSVSLWKAQVVRLDKLTWLGMKRRTDSDLRRDACLAAIELHDAVDRFNAQRPKTKQLQTRIGLDAGIVGFGPVAGELQTLGNAANTATRIEELKKLSTMPLASSDVVRDLEEFILRRLGFFPLSDKPGEVRIVEVFELRGVGTASELDQRLCEQFAAGLELYERQRWSDAARLFQGLAVAYPLDGPTAYYRDVCEDFLRSPRTAG